MNGGTGDGADEGAEIGTVALEPFRASAGKRLVQWEYDPNDLVKVLLH
jgi:hypothetical protein